MRNAFLDFVGIVTALFQEVWPDARTTEQVMRSETMTPQDDDYTGCHVQFYVALVEGLETIQMVAQYLISHQWSCFITESADALLSKS
eukprot:symbB.v1.2.035777.t1/scaffold4899.1/size33228/4